MAKIYVSSTYLDLQEYRAQVERVIRRMGHTDVAMEYYVAEDQRPVAKCLADVTACDVYVGIFAWRYGWQPKENNPENYSITEMEFRQAEKSGIPCLIFLLNEDTPWPRKHMDKDITRIETFRNTASARHNPDWFTTPDKLARKVAEAIHKRIPAAVPIPEHNLDAYYSALRKRYGVLALEDLTPPQKEEYLQIQLRAVFVEQNVRESPPPVELPKEVWEKLSRDKEIHPDDLPSGITLDDVRKAREAYYEKPSRPVLDVLTDSRYQYTIILGDPGSGKSTLARYVMLSLIDPTPTPALPRSEILRTWEGVMPLLIELQSYAGLCADDKCNSFLEFLEYLGKTEGWALTQVALHNHLKNDGRAVVIFDGLDEIFDPELRERITHQIVGFCGAYPSVRVIVTSRVIGYRRKILTDANFAHFTLQDLDEKQVETFVSRWYDLAMSDRPDEARERRERILRSFKESASIRQLAGNPMLLTIMAIIGKHQELPRERWKLYDHAASVLIQHWDVNKHLKDARIDADFIGEDDKKELLRRLAFRMQGGDGGLTGNYIHREQLQAEFEDYLRERYAQTPDRAVTIARAMIEQFRERNFILSLYGANLYGFVHRAFLEFFCASVFVYKFEKTKELTIDQLKADVYGKHWEDQSWHEVLRLICGMIDPGFTGQIIDFLATEAYQPQSIEDFGYQPPWNLALAIECMSEVTNLSTMAEPAMRLLGKVCSLFDHDLEDVNGSPRYYLFLGKWIVPAVRKIGSGWPGRNMVVGWLEGRKSFFRAWVHGQPFGEFVGSVGAGMDSVREMLLNYLGREDRNYRFLAPYALAKGWPNDPVVFERTTQCVTNDNDEWVRYACTFALAECANNVAVVKKILFDRAVSDESGLVRRGALYSLAQSFSGDENIPNLMHDRATRDKDVDVRVTAVLTLAEYFHQSSETLALLRDRAVRDRNWRVRASALSMIARYFHSNHQTLPLLLQRIRMDRSPHFRYNVLDALFPQYADDPRVLSLLNDHTLNDEDPRVRIASLSMLVEHFRYRLETKTTVSRFAVDDPHEMVRQEAVQMLAQKFHEDLKTLLLLQDRAVNDADKKVRGVAVYWLGKHYFGETQTVELLRDRTLNDPDESVRRVADQALHPPVQSGGLWAEWAGNGYVL